MFTTLNQSLAFHQSPEAFISSRLQELSAKKSGSFLSTIGEASITEASILNRQVHIVSSYRICRDILKADDLQTLESITSPSSNVLGSNIFSIGPAYRQLMKDWFGEQNILLEDAQVHTQHKEAWKRQTASLPADLEPQIRRIAREFITSTFLPGKKIDLYETLKTLAWRLLLSAFLALDADENNDIFEKVEQAQEELLRGQFSLFPVSINALFFQSARSRGLRARQLLQQILSKHIQMQNPARCPLLRRTEVDRDDIANHCLLFTSSIANKALSSLLTATMMNIFLMPNQNLAALLATQPEETRAVTLRSILLETERLSPPVVGVMRRVEEDIVLKDGTAGKGHMVSNGHDVWLYFVGAARDESVFKDAQKFHFDRFMSDATPHGFAFAAGRKTCLGNDTVRMMVFVVAEEMLKANIELRGEPQSEGVQVWLGWKATTGPQAIAKDLKQLPCQRPRLPVWVEVSETR
ncbi:hypothetical protein H2198_003149 [Neophaeococcomyces mojaviensis]|uniref:Uncharacterized protein n=1 Tax=Neophaeococcomyces mojaviensis TaxID=3383035 RepID=A0ACC3AC60_9EURO|nr:hypothetical protein H2198_003149 [Knufia sp. JES_112]